MIISMMRIVPPPRRRNETLELLRSVQGPTQAQPGCGHCHIYYEDGSEQAILFCEQWESEAALHRHIRSEAYQRVLAALELSGKAPEVSFHHVTATQGIELVHQLRDRHGDTASSALLDFVSHLSESRSSKASKL
jgi:quinol monooxygenase YgiN